MYVFKTYLSIYISCLVTIVQAMLSVLVVPRYYCYHSQNMTTSYLNEYFVYFAVPTFRSEII